MGINIQLSEVVSSVVDGTNHSRRVEASRQRHIADEYGELIEHCAKVLYELSNSQYSGIAADAERKMEDVREIFETGQINYDKYLHSTKGDKDASK